MLYRIVEASPGKGKYKIQMFLGVWQLGFWWTRKFLLPCDLGLDCGGHYQSEFDSPEQARKLLENRC